MSSRTKIEWTRADDGSAGQTWNPITGCTKVSPGCEHCYIERTPPFRMAGRRFDQPGVGGATGVQLHPDRLPTPLRWRKPRRVFVNSLADLFHDDVPDGFIAAMWFIMGQSAGCIPERYRGHTFQILTKRPARMRAWMRKWADVGDPAIPPMDPAASRCGRAQLIAAAQEVFGAKLSYDWMDGPRYWPTALPGVWLGVSIETQQWADIRIPILLDTPAVVRWLSCEPLLGPLDLDEWFCSCGGRRWVDDQNWSPEDYERAAGRQPGAGRIPCGICNHGGWAEPDVDRPGIDWVVAGGESGPGARPMHPDWARGLRDRCTSASVPFFFKQWGEWQDGSHDPRIQRGTDHIIVADGRHETWLGHTVGAGEPGTPLARARLCREAGTERAVVISRVGRKAAGRELDGRTWDEYPRPG